MNGPRYAVYFAPGEADPLADIGARLLGYDAATGREVDQVALPGVDGAEWRAWTQEPRRYGFHATLKAPFRLLAGRSERELIEFLGSFAATRKAFRFHLKLTAIGGFIAFTPAVAPTEIDVLETAIVEAFEPFRAPLDEQGLSRRLAAPLTPRQRDHLDRYGYPHVLQDFRFHMTLTGRLDEAQRARAMAALAAILPPSLTARVDSLCLFRQDDADRPFVIVARADMRGA